MSAIAKQTFPGDGEMARRMRELDWSRTALGPVRSWPTSLKTTVGVLLGNRFPMCLFWGPSLVNLNNDAYRPILGEKHPASLGARGPEIWREIWHIIGPQAEGVLAGAPATWNEHLLLPMNRRGYVEETYFTFSYSPVPDDEGRVGGVLVTCQETTAQVQDDRQLRMLHELSSHTMQQRSAEEACQAAMKVLASHVTDIPFAIAYLLAPNATHATLAGYTGLGDHPACERMVSIDVDAAAGDHAAVWPFGEVLRAGTDVDVAELSTRLGSLPLSTSGQPVSRACVLPLGRAGHAQPWGFLIGGLNPWRAVDERYRRLIRLTAERIASAIANAEAYAEERRRAEALAEIDRAKTTFFSNVSHEFRTPLTLMIGPIEEALGSPEAALEGNDLRAVHGSTLRLLKLVNTLLDFSRIEAGRIQACYVPADLAADTSDIASAFRSAIERGGLRFEVDCPRLDQAVYVDRDMWEKLVANLLSNAFKFTLEGAIRVRLRALGDHVELTVADTGIGMPEHELPRVFERFHRIEGARARTLEGSGIGLALVHEIVYLHGGKVSVASKLGTGTTFTVKIPFGTAHLPQDRIGAATSLESTAVGAEPFVQEALRWLPDAAAEVSAASPPALARSEPRPMAATRVLVADDNADLRGYLSRLLAQHWTVKTATDGLQALAAARAWSPDLIITDVMMPNLDGFGLLAALRADASTAKIPVIMLSARAGEESRVEGLQAGADDYLVKPFSARELVARAATHIQLAHARAQSEREHERLRRFLMNAPFAIVWLEGPQHRVVLSNPQHRALIGGRDITGMNLIDALPELEGQQALQVLMRVHATGERFVHSELQVQFAQDGGVEPRWFKVLYEPLRDDEGEIEGILVCAMDVTDHVLGKHELEHARELAETATRAKDEFLAMLGHELRNPLAPILTAIQLLRMRGPIGPELNVVERQTHQLVRLVDDLLDVSRITRGKLALRKQRLEIASAVQRGLEIASPMLEQRRQQIVLDVPAEGLVIDGDPDRLAQVVSNLLTNAAKYSESDTTISVTARSSNDWVEVHVCDRGIGIAPEMLGRIFDTFVQQPQALDRAKGGLGIGLAIVRSLVELHGGKVHAHSAGPGRGSEFVIELPLAATDSTGRSAPSLADVPSRAARSELARRVLVVDDNVDAAASVADVLSALGHQVQVAYDGPAALRVARNFRPNVCLLDIGLPVMDGYALARQLRAMAELPGEMRIVAVTGYGRDSDRRQTSEAGFDDHLVKPVALEALASAVTGA